MAANEKHECKWEICVALCCSDRAAPPEMPIVIDHVALKDILGPPLFEMEVSRAEPRGAAGQGAAFRICRELTHNYRNLCTVDPQILPFICGGASALERVHSS